MGSETVMGNAWKVNVNAAEHEAKTTQIADVARRCNSTDLTIDRTLSLGSDPGNSFIFYCK